MFLSWSPTSLPSRLSTASGGSSHCRRSAKERVPEFSLQRKKILSLCSTSSCKNLKNPQLSSASSKSFSRRQQTAHTRHKTKCLKFSCYSSHSLVEQHKVTRTSQNQKTAVPTAGSRSKVVSDRQRPTQQPMIPTYRVAS